MRFRSLCTASATALAVGLFIAPAHAQTQPADSATNPCTDSQGNAVPNCPSPEGRTINAEAANAAVQSTGSSAPGGDIVVVGSRLRRDRFNTADPVTVITREETTQAGFASTADVLQSTGVTNGTTQINNSFAGLTGFVGGPGSNTVSLRGLGSTRTLVLLNGRRISPAGAQGRVGATDLNVLPNGLVDRIEILNTGASSVYGSDAVAGVVNVVTLRHVDGFTLEGQVNVPEVGAGVSQRVSAIFGFNTDRLHVAGALEYFRRNDLTLGDEAFARCQTSYRTLGPGTAPDSGSFIDPNGHAHCYPTGVTGENGITVNTLGTPSFNGTLVAHAAGVPAGYGALPASAGFGTPAQQVCNRFRPNPAAGGALPGYECVGGGALSLSIRDTFPGEILNNSIVSPVTTYTGFAQASYETGILGDAELYTEAWFNRRDSAQTGSRQLTMDYPFGSPLIPANLRFAAPFLGPQGRGTSTAGTQSVGDRAFTNGRNYLSTQQVDFFKLSGGLRGRRGLGDWRYDVYASNSWVDAVNTVDNIILDRAVASFDVVQNANGTFSCRIGGACIPAPALTPAVIGGTVPQDWLNYIHGTTVGHTSFRELVANVTVDGTLFRMPEGFGGGSVRAAIGAEYRHDSLNDQPDPQVVQGNLLNFSTSTPTVGKDAVKEVYGEIEIPLLRDLPFARDLTISASARYTDYRSYGSNTTYRVNALYTPVQWLSFRGGYGTSFRAPAIFEQRLGASSGFQSQNNDPCNNYDAPGVNPARAANCRSEGLPAGFSATSSIAVLQQGGAATGLSAETSRNYTFGGILQPRFGRFGDLSLSVDYFHTKVSNGVSLLNFGQILATCYDDPLFRNGGALCSLSTRGAASPFPLTVTTGYVNVATDFVAGVDFNLRYAVQVGPGRLRLNGAVTRFSDRYTQTLPTDAILHVVGTLGLGVTGATPRWSGTFDAAYEVHGFTFRYGVDWIQHLDSTTGLGLDPATSTFIFRTPDYYLHNASIQYRASDFTLTMGVRNLFDKQPPFISSGAYNRIGDAPLYSGFDYIGRQFFVSGSFHF
jgi:outer membrane receptor protein involved in Fe transport